MRAPLDFFSFGFQPSHLPDPASLLVAALVFSPFFQILEALPSDTHFFVTISCRHAIFFPSRAEFFSLG